MMRTQSRTFVPVLVGFVVMAYSLSVAAQETLADHCRDTYAKTGACPKSICKTECLKSEGNEACENICVAQDCTDIPVNECPLKYCAVMVDCTGTEICHFRMEGGRPRCGDSSYAGQDADCCDGLVRRCGYEFYDGTCDMEGKSSVYSLPICIPCGNTICEQFEDRCNCPEDCIGGEYNGFSYDEYLKQKESEVKEATE